MPKVKDCISVSWDTLKKNPWIIIGVFVCMFALSGVLNGFLTAFLPIEGPDATPGSSAMNFFLSMTIGALIEIGLVTFVLKAQSAADTLSFHDLWNPQPFLRYLIAQLLVAVTVLVGFVLLIIPGIIAGIALMFTPYLVVDKHLTPIDAMKESLRMTKGNRWELFLLMLALLLLNFLGMFAFFVGLLVTIPMSMLAIAHVYRILESAPESIPTA